MSTWTINGVSIADLGIGDWSLDYASMLADKFQWDDPLAAFDSDPRWPFESEIEVALDGVVKFRGLVDDLPSYMGAKAESITYVALGPWDWLEKRPYVQFFKIAEDPADAEPVLIDKYQGRVVLGQADDGQKIDLGEAIAEVIASAIEAGCPITLGVIEGLDFKIPWQEVTDTNHAAVIRSMLQLAPDAVSWWDYTGLMPSFNVSRRHLLPAHTYNVPAKGQGGTGTFAPFESIKLRPCYNLQSAGVVLFYLRTNRENDRAWREVDIEAYPPDTEPRNPRVNAFTITLAGSVYNETRPAQVVRSQFINELLVTAGSTSILPTGDTAAQFEALARFWKRKYPVLKKSGVTILGFRRGTRVKMSELDTDAVDEAFTPECERELTAGAITDWMQTRLNVKAEYQKISVEVIYKAPTPNPADDPTKTEIKGEVLTAIITATSATSKTYAFVQDSSGTQEEEKPADMAERLYGMLSDLQQDGTFDLVSTEPSAAVRPGQVVNLACAAKPEWLVMRALVQSARLKGRDGRTSVTVRPANLSSFADLISIWRNNRESDPVTVASARTGGQEGGGGNTAGLSVFHPRNDISSTPLPPLQETTAAVEPAGAVATKEELVAAVKAKYEALGITPLGGQWMNIPVTGRGTFRAYIHTSDSNLGGQWNASFTMGEGAAMQTFWVTLQQLGIY